MSHETLKVYTLISHSMEDYSDISINEKLIVHLNNPNTKLCIEALRNACDMMQQLMTPPKITYCTSKFVTDDFLNFFYINPKLIVVIALSKSMSLSISLASSSIMSKIVSY